MIRLICIGFVSFRKLNIITKNPNFVTAVAFIIV